MIRAHRIDETSVFLDQTCALCKQAFAAGDEIVVCPEDGSRHHVHCWQANDNKCTAYGCTGAGVVGERPVSNPMVARQRRPATRERPNRRPRVITQPAESPTPAAARPIPNAPGSKVRTLPAGSFGCGQSCLLLAIAIAILLFAVGCFGLWAIADYLMLQVWDVPYRAPLAPGLIFQIASLGGAF